MDDLEDLYREIILDHYRSPRNRGELDSPPAHRTEGFNPPCGDEIVLTVVVDEGVIRDLKIAGHGCSISQSSASLMSGAVKGKSVDDARVVMRSFKRMMTVGDDDPTAEDEPVDVRKLGELAALQGVVKFPVRIKCATLAWNTLNQALVELDA